MKLRRTKQRVSVFWTTLYKQDKLAASHRKTYNMYIDEWL